MRLTFPEAGNFSFGKTRTKSGGLLVVDTRPSCRLLCSQNYSQDILGDGFYRFA
jgi:hypothetical protein